MADWTKAKLGTYIAGKRCRVIVVPGCDEDEDPRIAVIGAFETANEMPKPKRKAKSKPKAGA